MMREILYRGKRRDNGEWMEGFPIRLYDYGGDSWEMVPFNTNLDTNHFVIPETIGQYTGMNDIVGKRIFEGDIMETAISGITYHRGVVEFVDGAFGLRCTDGSAYFLCFVAENYAIIGNVYENADLLEG